jgi:hypothetical protein
MKYSFSQREEIPMKALKRKNYSLEEAKVKKLRRLLRTNSETEALHKAVDMVLFQQEAAKAWIENAGAGGVEDLYAR